MSIINTAPSERASAQERLIFCGDQLDILIDLCDVLERSILTDKEKIFHSDAWLVQIIRQEMETINKELGIVSKSISGGRK